MTWARTVTLDDVAAAAGVHASTVSRALSRPDLVNANTRTRVSAAIDELGYVPNRAARQLAGGRTATIAMLVPDITNPFFSGIVHAAQAWARREDQLLLLADTTQDPRTELDAIRSLMPNVDGLVLCAPVATAVDAVRAAGPRPIVFVNRRARGVSSVSVDQAAVVRLAVAHLRDLGHRWIAAAPGPTGYWSSRRRSQAIDRLDPPLTVLRSVEPTFEGGHGLLADVLAAEVTAVVAFNDVMALGLIAAATAAGVDVPERLSVVGADGVPLGAMTTPALTTVAVDLDLLGHLAVAGLAARIRGDDAVPDEQTVVPTLVVRASTAPRG